MAEPNQFSIPLDKVAGRALMINLLPYDLDVEYENKCKILRPRDFWTELRKPLCRVKKSIQGLILNIRDNGIVVLSKQVLTVIKGIFGAIKSENMDRLIIDARNSYSIFVTPP